MTCFVLAALLASSSAPIAAAQSDGGVQAPAAQLTCAGPTNCPPCQFAVCNIEHVWECTGVTPAGVACNDGNSCTSGDHCDGFGSCVGNPYSCTPTSCQLTSVCNGSGGCTTTAKSNGALCQEASDKCVDHCEGGVCTASADKCTSPGVCQSAPGTCQPTTGACTYPNAPDQTPCNDGSACTKNDVCTNGSCGGTAYSCAAPDTCHTGGACDGAGGCSYADKPNGTACDDNNALTQGETCTDGVCGHPTGCSGSATLCNGTCVSLQQTGSCCTDSDCLVSGNEGHQSCVNNTCAGTPTCADGFIACGSSCIPQGACCSSADCPGGMSCVDNACTLGCAAGFVACGPSCVQTGAQVCCPSDNI